MDARPRGCGERSRGADLLVETEPGSARPPLPYRTFTLGALLRLWGTRTSRSPGLAKQPTGIGEYTIHVTPTRWKADDQLSAALIIPPISSTRPNFRLIPPQSARTPDAARSTAPPASRTSENEKSKPDPLSNATETYHIPLVFLKEKGTKGSQSSEVEGRQLAERPFGWRIVLCMLCRIL